MPCPPVTLALTMALTLEVLTIPHDPSKSLAIPHSLKRGGGVAYPKWRVTFGPHTCFLAFFKKKNFLKRQESVGGRLSRLVYHFARDGVPPGAG